MYNSIASRIGNPTPSTMQLNQAESNKSQQNTRITKKEKHCSEFDIDSSSISLTRTNNTKKSDSDNPAFIRSL